MTKTKHPQSRWDRLQVKKKFEEKKSKGSSGKVRRKLVREIQTKETEDDLREYANH